MIGIKYAALSYTVQKGVHTMESYFLGANTKAGFSSLYGDFPPKGAYLHVLKGGPGTGKSSLLKAIARAARERGFAAEQVLCSGDPESLDGVYIPALRQAWADGTSPHVLEPRLLGVTGDYIDLSAYLILPFSEAEKQELLKLQEQNKACYRLAYDALAACAAMGRSKTAAQEDTDVRRLLEELPEKGERKNSRRCYLSAISCKGALRLEDQLADFAKLPASPEVLAGGSDQVREKGYEAFLCPSPLDPAIPEALVLPEEKLCLHAVFQPTEEASGALREAISHLAQAKQIHDRMELLYRPHMDFRALSEYTERLIQGLFS